ncbi:MAG: ATP-binding cassette domain-containing protein, partial [Lachnospiraceae bacterium]|nr:ATP-binding cassette domain-containing protein [Lachnospiraceae bacterium]
MGLLSCHNVSFTYDGKTVLSNINFEINPGDYLCILGENGAGKSTLIKGILNLKKVATGRILTGDGLKTNEIGYLPQQTQVQKDFPASVNEIVISGRLNNCGMRPFYSKEDKKVANSNMEKLGIYGLRKSCYRELSGGQQQRVLLARALCATKKLLLLDEPITGLDPVMSVELY